MITLAEFLLARIAEDEQDLREARGIADMPEWWAPPAWSRERGLAECAVKRAVVETQASSRIVHRRKPWHSEAFSPYHFHLLDEVGNVIAEGDEAHRLFDEHSDPVTDTPVLRILAQVYADHPDYQPDWAPTESR